MTKTTIKLFLFFAMLVSSAVAQDQPSGGRIQPTTKPKVETESKPATKPTRPAAVDRIDGRWWTTGNDFGASEIVFTQNGSNISGEIHYVDGRTGNLSGTFANKRLKYTFSNSSGETGSGWLELSWINFLGGPWRSARVKDGSWTMNRIEGLWCPNGDKNRALRVTHDVTGRMTIVGADGSQLSGQLEGTEIYLDTSGTRIKGSMFYKSIRIDWANGTSWSWCGR
jgi:hypothetical protein